MTLEHLLADSMLYGGNDVETILTSVANALIEVQERNKCNCKLTMEQIAERNKPYNEASELIFRARNVFRNKS